MTLIVLGLYTYTRAGFSSMPVNVMKDAVNWLRRNLWIFNEHDIRVYAGDSYSKEFLEKIGLKPKYPELPAPRIVIENRAHFMKHWIVYSVLKEYGELLWMDWDTVVVKPLDRYFWGHAKRYGLPKFIRLDNYPFYVNAGVYYVGGEYGLFLVRDSLKYMYNTWPPNDELLWMKTLKEHNVDERKIWWNDLVIDTHDMLYSVKKEKAYIIHNV